MDKWTDQLTDQQKQVITIKLGSLQYKALSKNS